jgi:carboxylesterase
MARTRTNDYILSGGRDAVLLIHGLTGTPQEMRPLAKALHRDGYTVCAVQLAGHCGSEQDLLGTGWRDWYASVCAAADHLRPQADRLFVGGLSMGALMALKLAADRPEQIAGVAAYGPTFRYDGWAIPPIGRLSFLLPMLIRIGIGRRRRFVERPPYGLKDERMRRQIAAAMTSGDSAMAGLLGNPWPSLAELYRLAAVVRRQLAAVRSPCLVVQAAEDDIAGPRNARLVIDGVAGPVETVVLRDSYHMMTLDRERHVVAARSSEFFSRIRASAFAPAGADAFPQAALQAAYR